MMATRDELRNLILKRQDEAQAERTAALRQDQEEQER